LTVRTELLAISLTANAVQKAQAAGVNLASLITLAETHATELSALLRQIVAYHPTGGSDAANLTALNAVAAELS
jgi:hypothetical protein